MLFADSFAELLPPISVTAVVALFSALLGGALVLRWMLGPSNAVSRRWSLWMLRAAILVIVAVVLLNPVRVDELPGPVQRPEVFYLVDSSASMQMGNPRSRWDEILRLIRESYQMAASSPAAIKPFRFGQRLAAIDDPSQIGIVPSSMFTPVSLNTGSKEGSSGRTLAPNDGDTRLLAALRQISSRFGRVPPQSIVLFSDGRAHDDVGLEQMAAEFARLKVPIHVVPVGDMTRGGDVAVAAVVAPPRVRKFTEVEIQVFIRSYGYDGKRSEVQLLEIVEGGPVGRTLSSLPITLQSGFQSVSLPMRTDLSTRKLRVAIPALPDEVSADNNQVDSDMGIDRTKIRVLYVEGSSQPLQQVRIADKYQLRGAFSDLKQALTEDEDVECVVLVSQGGYGQLVRMAEYSQVDGVRGFPSTVAELAAFDAIILSNVSAQSFTEKQLEWIDQWIGQRGGGLCMVGGENSFASGGWANTRLAAMLPVEMLPESFDWVPGETVRIVPELPASPHALWNLLADEKQNREVVAKFPVVTGINRLAAARPNLTSVLATTPVSGQPVVRDEGFSSSSPFSVFRNFVGQRQPKQLESQQDMPAIVAGRYGRGRTLAVAFPITSPYADELVQQWGVGDNRYYGKFARNLVYWLTESSAIGRRRLVASADKRFYRPGETVAIQAATYDESASPTKDYRVVAMVEPHSGSGDIESIASPLRWPEGMLRTSGEEGPFVVWGEEFELSLNNQENALHAIQLPLAEVLSSGTSSQSLRVELTAYEDLTQVDSTSLDIQILHDPFEQQNPFPNHEALASLAAGSGGQVLKSAEDIAEVLNDVPANVGPPVVRRSPLWSNGWVLGLLLGLLTVEWCWRRSLGLA